MVGTSSTWERARELVGMEENPDAGLLPNPITQHEVLPGVTIEEAAIQDNLGEFPDRFTDQGDWRETPMTREQQRKAEAGELSRRMATPRSSDRNAGCLTVATASRQRAPCIQGGDICGVFLRWRWS